MARIDRPDSTGGGAGIGGGARTGAGITGKAGRNVNPIYKNVKEPSSNVKVIGKRPEEEIPPHDVMWRDGGNKYGLGH